MTGPEGQVTVKLMIPNLQAALQAIGKCEQTYFDSPDWYARFGFIYMTFLADRYKRAR